LHRQLTSPGAALPNRLMVIFVAILLTMASLILVSPALRSADVVKAASDCQLDSANDAIKHVIYLQFDNTHFRRDNPNVPSDLEQMPHLLNFIRDNGTLLTNDHTVLISHTAGGIMSSLTGVYPDRHGQAVSNSFRYYRPDASGLTNNAVSFAYWTAPVFTVAGSGPFDTNYNMVTETGQNAPAPWVPFTRAGCSFGAFATGNVVLENTGIDVATVFGPSSPEAAEVVANPAQAFADYVGVAVHCAASDPLCSTANHGRPDLLPQEPGGYTGFNALFGAKYVAPVITNPSGPMRDLDGNVIQDFAGGVHHTGFPGFDGDFPTNSLAYVAQMQEAGIPVTYAYITDAHDDHGQSGEIHIARGPGEAGYVSQLQRYDQAFAKFFDRLAADGINKTNTLFVVTVEEGDHFVGSQPSPAGCDGVNTPCSYTAATEINGNLRGLLEAQQGITTPFTVHSDMAPTVYLNGNPSRTDAVTRAFERATGQLQTTNLLTGATDDLTVAMADPVEMDALHMVTGDPLRTPTFTMFAHPDYFLFAAGLSGSCGMPSPPCVTLPGASNQTFAWNHGGIAPEIANTWVGIVGPGVRNLGQDNTTWTDHTDLRPTILHLVGLEDDYVADGRVIAEPLYAWALPTELVTHRSTWLKLAQTYKQLNAPFGQFGMSTLLVSTAALKSGSAGDDSTYVALENEIATWAASRDALAVQMGSLLTASAFDGMAINTQQAKSLIAQGQALLDAVTSAAAGL